MLFIYSFCSLSSHQASPSKVGLDKASPRKLNVENEEENEEEKIGTLGEGDRENEEKE